MNQHEGTRIQMPGYLTYFYRKDQPLFQSICELDEEKAEEILSHDVLWRGDGTYLKHRKKHDAYLRQAFIAKGGKPKLEYPVYLLLGDSPTGPHDMYQDYEFSLQIPVNFFPEESVSYTYPDSMYKIPVEEPGKLYLERDPAPPVYLLHEVPEIIRKYEVFIHNNHYIEAQVWDKEPLERFYVSLQE